MDKTLWNWTLQNIFVLFSHCHATIFKELPVFITVTVPSQLQFFKNFMCMHVCLHLCMCTMCMLGTCRGQKRPLDPLDLELWMLLSHHVETGNRTWSSAETAESSLQLPTSSNQRMKTIIFFSPANTLPWSYVPSPVMLLLAQHMVSNCPSETCIVSNRNRKCR